MLETKTKKAIGDFKELKVVEKFSSKPITGTHPVILALIKEAMRQGSSSTTSPRMPTPSLAARRYPGSAVHHDQQRQHPASANSRS